MKRHKYTNKNERPVPRYMTGDVAWKKSSLHNYDVEYTTIRAICDVRWVDYSDNPLLEGRSSLGDNISTQAEME